jgi:hypothetical protein
MTLRILNKKNNRLIQENMLDYRTSSGGTRMTSSDRSDVIDDF